MPKCCLVHHTLLHRQVSVSKREHYIQADSDHRVQKMKPQNISASPQHTASNVQANLGSVEYEWQQQRPKDANTVLSI